MLAVRRGAYFKDAASAVGVTRRTLATWRQDDPDLDARLDEAYAAFTNESVEIIAELGKTDWRARAWILERTRGKDFREEKAVEVSGELSLEQILFNSPQDALNAEAEEIAGLLNPSPAAEESA